MPSLTRLLSAGQAALENLSNSTGHKSARLGSNMATATMTTQLNTTGMSPTMHIHRRSITTPMLGQGNNLVTALHPRSGSSSSLSQLSFQSLNTGSSAVYDSHTGSPRSSPLQRVGPQMSLLSSAQPTPTSSMGSLMSPSAKSSHLGNIGFFSGSDSGLWAPSPKAIPNVAGGSNAILTSSQGQTRLERFTFDRPDGSVDFTTAAAAAAWSHHEEEEEEKFRMNIVRDR